MAQIFWFDLETTGLDPNENGIIEIAGIFNKPGSQSKRFERLVDPRKGTEGNREVAIHPKALETNGLTLDEIADFDPIDKMIRELDSHVDPWCIPAGWNVAGFDIPFLKAAYERAGVKWRFHYHCLDMMVVANWLKQAELIDARSLSLQNMAKYLGIDATKFGDAHRAMPDVYTTLEISRIFRERYLGGGTGYKF